MGCSQHPEGWFITSGCYVASVFKLPRNGHGDIILRMGCSQRPDGIFITSGWDAISIKTPRNDHGGIICSNFLCSVDYSQAPTRIPHSYQAVLARDRVASQYSYLVFLCRVIETFLDQISYLYSQMEYCTLHNLHNGYFMSS